MFRKTRTERSPLGQIISAVVSRVASNPEVQAQVKKYAAEAGKQTARLTYEAKKQWQQIQQKQQQQSSSSAKGSSSSSSGSSGTSSSSSSSFSKAAKDASSQFSNASAQASTAASQAQQTMNEAWKKAQAASTSFMGSSIKSNSHTSSSSSSSSASHKNYGTDAKSGNSGSSSSSYSGGSATGGATGGANNGNKNAWNAEMRARAFIGRMQAKLNNWWQNFSIANNFMLIIGIVQVTYGLVHTLVWGGKGSKDHAEMQKSIEKKKQKEEEDRKRIEAEEKVKNQDTLKAEGGLTVVNSGEVPASSKPRTKKQQYAQIVTDSVEQEQQSLFQAALGSAGRSPMSPAAIAQQRNIHNNNSNSTATMMGSPTAPTGAHHQQQQGAGPRRIKSPQDLQRLYQEDPFAPPPSYFGFKDDIRLPRSAPQQQKQQRSVKAGVAPLPPPQQQQSTSGGVAGSSGGFQTSSEFKRTSFTFGENKTARPNIGYDPLAPRQVYGESEGVSSSNIFSFSFGSKNNGNRKRGFDGQADPLRSGWM